MVGGVAKQTLPLPHALELALALAHALALARPRNDNDKPERRLQEYLFNKMFCVEKVFF